MEIRKELRLISLNKSGNKTTIKPLQNLVKPQKTLNLNALIDSQGLLTNTTGSYEGILSNK